MSSSPQEKERLKTSAARGPRYGGADSEAPPEAAAGSSKEWADFGDPLMLLVSVGYQVGRQVAPLVLIIMNVFFSHDHLMSCDSRVIGVPIAVACEYTKAYVRCFPLLAIVIALMVASRQLLQQRMYYQLLRHGALLDIENFSPLSDPLFRIALWCTASAVLHFALNVWRTYSIDLFRPGSLGAVRNPDLLNDVQQETVFFIVPAALVVVFLYSAYDTEASLLPLSKYFEEDPAEARRVLGAIPFLPEPAAAAAVRQDLCPSGEPCRLPDEADEAFQELVRCAEARVAASERGDEDAVPPLSNWRLVSTMWPSLFLLHGSRTDRESASFRRVWAGFCAVALLAMGVVFYFFVFNILDKARDVAEGQYTDLAGVAVSVAHATASVWLAWGFIQNALVPLRT